MNIFKILASGDGTIDEPNVSAFLGYLLDPKADHGIGDEFLNCVLSSLYENHKGESNKGSSLDFLVDINKDIRDLSANSNLEFKVLLEQAFKSNEAVKKEIVDIVILCFEKKKGNTESLARIELSNFNKGELKQIFLIENKIKDSSSNKAQLIGQCKSTIETLEDILKDSNIGICKQNIENISSLVSIIFISPKGSKSDEQYSTLENDKTINIPKLHIHYKDAEESITSFLREILSKESTGEIEAINEYTKTIIKSFITFIENDFKSAIEEKFEGETVRVVVNNFEQFKNKFHSVFNENSWGLIESFQNEIKKMYATKNTLNIRYSRTHPVSVLLKENSEDEGKKIFSLTRRGKNLIIHLVHGNHSIDPSTLNEFIGYLKNLGNFEVIQENTLIALKSKSNSITLEDALTIFNKQYKLITK
jgi:hypothetical protein